MRPESRWPLWTLGVLSGCGGAGATLLGWWLALAPVLPTAVAEERATPLVPQGVDTTLSTTQAGPGVGEIGAFEARVATLLARARPSVQRRAGDLRIVVRGIRWQEATGETFARADSAVAMLDSRALANGDIVLRDSYLANPHVNLVEVEAGGEWNYAQVLAPLFADTGSARQPGGRLFALEGMRIVAGRVNVDMPDRRFDFRNLEAAFHRLVFLDPTGADPHLSLDSTTANLVLLDTVPPSPLQVARPDSGRVLPLKAVHARLVFPRHATTFAMDSMLVAGAPLLQVEGEWSPDQPGYGVHAHGRADIRLSDVRGLLPDTAATDGAASFAWQVAPRPDSTTLVELTDIAARGAGSAVTGSVTAVVGGEAGTLEAADLRLQPLTLGLVSEVAGPLPFGGQLTGSVQGSGGQIGFDLAAGLTSRWNPTPFPTDLSGQVRFTDRRLVVDSIRARFADVPLAALLSRADSSVTTRLSGHVALTGAGDGRLGVQGSVQVGDGVATVDGTVGGLLNAVPTYDLSGRLIGIHLDGLTARPVPPVGLNLSFAVAGRGTDPDSLNARLDLSGRFLGWRSQPSDSIRVLAAVQDSRVSVDTLSLKLAGLRLLGSGQWRFTAPGEGQVEYRAAVADMGPWGPYLPVIGDSVAVGRLEGAGAVSGSLRALQLAGTADGGDLQVGGWKARAITTRYDLQLGDSIRQIVLHAGVQQLGTPTAGAFDDATVNARLVRPSFSLDLDATRSGGGKVELALEGRLPGDSAGNALLRRARLDVAAGSWLLSRPARLHWSPGGVIAVDSLLLRQAKTGGEILVAGRVWPVDSVATRFALARIPVGRLQHLAGRTPRVTGLLNASGEFTGPGVAPAFNLGFQLDSGTVEGVTIHQISGTASYRDHRLTTKLNAAMDTAGLARLDVTLPLDLRLADGFQASLVKADSVAGTLTADSVQLHPFGVLSRRIQNLTGRLDGRVTLAGTAQEPAFGGTLALANGGVSVPLLRQRYRQMTGSISLEGRRLTIHGLRAQSDGWLDASGTVTFEDLTKPVADVSVQLEGFRPMGVSDQKGVAVTGNLAIKGSPDALTTGGQLALRDGFVEVPQFGANAGNDFAALGPLPGAPESGAAPTNRVQVQDLTIRIGDGVWFSSQESRVQLMGDVTVNKHADELRLRGRLEGERGSYLLQAGPILRRFEITHAEVRFLDTPPPNPALDILAHRIVIDPNGRQVDVQVRIGGNLDAPTLSLASAEFADIPQSELLSFLLFGQPSFALGGGTSGSALVEQTLAGGAADLVTAELQRALSEGLGLSPDVFQVRFGTSRLRRFTSPTVVVGQQIAPDVFLTVETAINALLQQTQNGPNIWAVRLEWAFDPTSTARIGVEPVQANLAVSGIGLTLPTHQQVFLQLRRRWTY